MTRHVLTPAYNRDYGSSKAVKADLLKGKDFVLNFMGRSTYANLDSFGTDDMLQIRYSNNTRVVCWPVAELKDDQAALKPAKTESSYATVEDFMEACDKVCSESYGVSIHDFADIGWWDLWDSGASPEEALEELAANDGLFAEFQNA